MENKKKLLYDIEDAPPLGKGFILALQHVFAMFGATILVPILVNQKCGEEVLSIPVALISTGVGTIIYQLCTKNKSPIYSGSSFSYIVPMALAFSTSGKSGLFTGILSVGLVYVLVSLIVKLVGTNWVDRVLPPIVVGPMIMIIGLNLAPTAINQIGLLNEEFDLKTLIVVLATFITTITLAVYGKGFFKVIPFLGGMTIGYIVAVIFGLVDFTPVAEASFFSLPNFTFIFKDYALDFSAVLTIAPVALVSIPEHIGDHTALGEIVGRNLLKDPGLARTLLGDGLGTIAGGILGGPPSTTYGENTAVVGMSKVASTKVLTLAAYIAVVFAFLGKLTALLSTIPNAVLGGVSLLLYGYISVNGLSILIKNKVDFNNTRNVIVSSAMLVLGLGMGEKTFNISLGNTTIGLTGLTLAAIVGIILNLILKKEEKSKS